MRDIPRFAAILMLVALIAAGCLAWVDKITKPKILTQEAKALQDALHYVLSDAQVIVPESSEGQILFYRGFSDKEMKHLAGYAFQADGEGYSSTIKTIVGIDTLFVIKAIKILSQQETPGLGTRCEEILNGETSPWWPRQFSGKNAREIRVNKDGGVIQAITGATITSRAITNAIAEKSRWLQKCLNP